MAKTPCAEGQTRNRKTKACRDKLKTGTRKSSPKKGSPKKNWTNLVGIRANINARLAAAESKIAAKKGSAKSSSAKSNSVKTHKAKKCPDNQTYNRKAKACRDKLKTGRKAGSPKKGSPKKNWTNLAGLQANLNARLAVAKKKLHNRSSKIKKD